MFYINYSVIAVLNFLQIYKNIFHSNNIRSFYLFVLSYKRLVSSYSLSTKASNLTSENVFEDLL